MAQNELREIAKKIIQSLYGHPQEEIYYNIGYTSIDELISNLNLSEEINLFPSNHKETCCLEAIFISIKHQPRLKTLSRNEMISLKTVIEKMVQHIFGECKEFTNQIILITDTIDTDILKPWISSIKKSTCWIEIIYVRENGEFETINNVIGL